MQVGALNEVLDFGVALIAADGDDQFDAGVDLGRVLLHQGAGALHELLLADGALIDVGELDVDGGVVDALIGAAAGGHQGVGDAGQSADLVRDALREVGGGGDRGAFGSADEDVVLRLIVLRQEVLADEHEERNDGENHEHAEGDHDLAVGHAPGEHARVLRYRGA